jgi:RNA polymerase sigma factor (sigma-70 family)
VSGSASDSDTKPAIDETLLLARRSEALRGGLVRFFKRRLQGADDIEDLVQEVFLRIVRRGQCHQIDNLDGYIFQTASSVLKDRGRRRKVRLLDRHVPLEPDVHGGADLGPERIVLGRESLKLVGTILLELSKTTRTVFVLRRLEGLPYQEIATRLGLSVSAVEKHMLRAVRHLIARVGKTHD